VDRIDTLVVTRHDLRRIVRAVGLNTLMDHTIENLHAALAVRDESATTIKPRDGFHLAGQEPGVFEWMPIMKGDQRITLKVVSYRPGNPVRFGMPTIVATNSVYEASTGHLLAMLDGVFATALRTGAASAIASRILAMPDSRTVGIIGCGAQAVTQLHALTRAFEVERALVFDVRPANAASYAARVSFLEVDVQVATIAEIEEQADIICTATSVDAGRGPVLAGTGVRDWVHVNAVGSDLPGKTELPLHFLQRSLVCPDFPAQALVEGECQQLGPDDIGPSLAELVQNEDRYRDWRQRATVFDSTGFALEDQIVTEVILQCAHEVGVGTRISLENVMGPPMDPYAYVLSLDDSNPWCTDHTASPRHSAGV
jgi:ornithine cyclodeaminase/alanine dehydrogenase-like protein (mu-crystallin family)